MLCNNATQEAENEIARKWKIAFQGLPNRFRSTAIDSLLQARSQRVTLSSDSKYRREVVITGTTRVSLNILRKFVCKIFETDVFDVFEVDMTRKA